MKQLGQILTCLAVFAFFSYQNIHAQTTEKLSLNSSNIENQFNYVIRKSDKIEDSRLVKTWWLSVLKAHVLDTMKLAEDKLMTANMQILVQKSKIDSLNTVIAETNKQLNTALENKENIKLLGISTSKKAYKSIMWSLVVLLSISLVILFVMFKRSNSVTVQAKADLDETRQEFEAHRKRALEREQKVVRELYDEVLKYKNKVKSP